MIRTITACCAGAALALSAAVATAQDGEIDGSQVQCLEYTNASGANSSNRAMGELAEFWIVGYMTGIYEGKDRLEWSEEADAEADLLSAVRSKCREFPTNSILTISESLSDRTRAIPTRASNDFNPVDYSCSAYVDASSGSAADVLKADLAEFWSFAFIQGYVNASDPEMVLPLENKPNLTGIIKRYCGENRDTDYFSLTKAVANAVRPQEAE